MKRYFSTTVANRVFSVGREIKKATPKDFKVEPILRPFGLPKPINLSDKHSSPLSLKNNSVFNKDIRVQKRDELNQEIARGGLYDVHVYRKTNGKVFECPPSYFKPEKSLYFPNFVGKTLGSKESSFYPKLNNKINIVRIFTNVSGDTCSRTFFKTEDNQSYLNGEGHQHFQAKYPNTQILEINMMENWIKSFFVKLSMGGIRKTVPKDRHDGYFIVPRSLFEMSIRDELKLFNVYSGYVYLIDNFGRIRWAGCGDASEEEQKLMWKCVRGLEAELKREQQK